MRNSTLNSQLSTTNPSVFFENTSPIRAIARQRRTLLCTATKNTKQISAIGCSRFANFPTCFVRRDNKKRMRRINGAFAFVVLSFRSRLIGWGGIPRMLPLLRRMPSRGGCKVVQLRGCDLRHVARTSGRRRRGTVHFPSAIDV